MIFRASFVPLVLDISAKPKTIPKQMQKGMVIFMDETDRTAPANAQKTYNTLLALLCYLSTVSYTHLDVYKRQHFFSTCQIPVMLLSL